MLSFVGQFQHTLDAKGRLILPAKFRSEFERGGHLSPNDEQCVALWTPGEFDRRAAEMRSSEKNGGAEERRLLRYWAGQSSDAEFDKQGRFAVPPAVREYANLVDEVLIVGVLDHIELWNPDMYNQMISSAEAIFKQGRN